MMTVEELYEKLYMDLKDRYKEEIGDRKKEELQIVISKLNVKLDVNLMYSIYQKNDGNYMQVLKCAIATTNAILKPNKENLNYNEIYPVLISSNAKEFVDDDIYRKHLFLDMYMEFKISLEGITWIPIVKEDNVDFNKINESALTNINNAWCTLAKIDEFDVHMAIAACDCMPSLFYNDNLQNLILKNIGLEYLFAVSSNTTLLFAKNSPKNVDYLKHYISIDPCKDKISNKIYLYKTGQYSCVDEV